MKLKSNLALFSTVIQRRGAYIGRGGEGGYNWMYCFNVIIGGGGGPYNRSFTVLLVSKTVQRLRLQKWLDHVISALNLGTFLVRFLRFNTISCLLSCFRVHQITFSVQIRLSHLDQIPRKTRKTHKERIRALQLKILSAIPLVLIRLVS